MRMRLAIGAVCALAVALALSIDGSSVLNAWTTNQCDFTTGGGYIYPQGQMTGNKANFAIAGGCKHTAFWGHLEYQDKAFYVKAHSNTVTGYEKIDDKTRLICGTGKTQDGRDFDWVVRVKDMGEPGNQDEFDIQLTRGINYTTAPGAPHKLGGGTRGGGNIQIHKSNPSTSGDVSPGKCPPFPVGGQVTLNIIIDSSTGSGTVIIVPAGGGATVTCTSSCSPTFPAGTAVTLTAQGDFSNSGNFPQGTNQDQTPNECDVQTNVQPPTCAVTLSTNRTVHVSFIFSE